MFLKLRTSTYRNISKPLLFLLLFVGKSNCRIDFQWIQDKGIIQCTLLASVQSLKRNVKQLRKAWKGLQAM